MHHIKQGVDHNNSGANSGEGDIRPVVVENIIQRSPHIKVAQGCLLYYINQHWGDKDFYIPIYAPLAAWPTSFNIKNDLPPDYYNYKTNARAPY